MFKTQIDERSEEKLQYILFHPTLSQQTQTRDERLEDQKVSVTAGEWKG